MKRLALTFAFAVASVRSNRRRVMLAVLGVAIGIAAVSSMLAIGHSVTAQAERALARLGGDIVTLNVRPHGAESTAGDDASTPVDPERANAVTARAELLLHAMPEVKASARMANLSPCLEAGNDPLAALDLLSATPQLQETLSLKMAQGRFLHRTDGAQGWVVLGAEAAQELAALVPALRPGASIEVCGRTLRIAGVLAHHDGDDLLPAFKVNRALIVLPELADRLGAPASPAQLLARVQADDAVDVGAQLSQRLSAVLGNTVTALGARHFGEMKHEQVALYTRFLAVLGCVSLLVGSLGITNVMLVAVAERRAEIGLRAAIGARPADIALQFMIESVLICLSGALLGLLLGLVGTAVALKLAQIEFSLGAGTPLVTALLALASGLAAGAYPALRAARLDPVTTLQGS